MSSIQDLDVQDIDHFGIIAGIIDEIGIVEIIDQLLSTRTLVVVKPSKHWY